MRGSVWGRTTVAIMVALSVLGMATIGSGYIAGSSGNAVRIAPPSSVTPTGVDHPTSVLVFDERQGVTLAAPVRVDFKNPGTYTGTIGATYVPAGSIVDSHFVDSSRSAGGVSVRDATVTFAQDILGVVATRGKLAETDVLGAPGTYYGGAYPSRELDFNEDWIRIVDARTIQLHVSTTTNTDQVRVLTKHNNPPTAAAGGPYAGTEGTPIALGGSAIDPDADALTYAWSFTPTGGPGLACTTTDTTTLTPSISCNDDALVSATLSASDPYHPAVTSPPTQIVIGNADPTSDGLVLPTGDIPVGATVVADASFADPGAIDTHTATLSWGDTTSSSGTVDQLLDTVTAGHAYAVGGIYTVTLTLTDDDGGIAFATGVVDINGVPSADAHGPYSGTEGAVIALSGSAGDVDGDPVTTEWVFSPGPIDPGTVCTPTATTTLTPTVSCNDDVVLAAQLTVDDGINIPVVSTSSVTVDNAAALVGIPSVTGAAFSAGETLTAAAPFTDSGTNDTHTASIDWGDLVSTPATMAESGGSGTASATHVYATAGTYTVTVTVVDDDGAVDSESIVVVVNTPPVVAAGGPYAGFEGTPSALAGTAIDVDGDPLTIAWTFTWTGVGVSCSTTDTTTLTPTITCDDDTLVSAVLTVGDGVNAPVTDTASLSVGNVSPVAGAATLTPAVVHTGTTVTLSIPFTDAGTLDTHSATIDWGDASTSAAAISESGGTGTADGTHAYAASGSYPITVTIDDDDGGSVTIVVTTGVTVNDAPVVAAGGPYAVDEGSVVALSGTATDPENDPLTYAWTFAWTGVGVACTWADDTTLTPTVTCDDNTLVSAVLVADDGFSSSAPATATVAVANVAPTTGPATAGSLITPVGNTVAAHVTFADVGTADSHDAVVSWDDGNTSAATVLETGGAGSVDATHVYTTPGIYSITITVADDDGGSTIATVVDYVVVYSASAGHVIASTRFQSPVGASTPGNPDDHDHDAEGDHDEDDDGDDDHEAELGGLARLGMNVEYANPGDTVPSGTAHFRFRAAHLVFRATGFQWLVINPGLTEAWFRGTGTVNGVAGYDFLVACANDGTDRVRIQVTNHTTGEVVYDSQPGDPDPASATTVIAGGWVRIQAS